MLLAGCTPASEPTASGEELYVNYCSACHGAQGLGDGPVAAVMQVSVPNLRTLSQRNGGSFPVDSATAFIDGRELPVSHGDRYMPIWGNVFTWPEGSTESQDAAARQRIDAIVLFLVSIQYP